MTGFAFALARALGAGRGRRPRLARLGFDLDFRRGFGGAFARAETLRRGFAGARFAFFFALRRRFAIALPAAGSSSRAHV